MYRHLALVNRKLYRNMQRLKDITKHMSRFKSALSRKYHQKVKEAAVMKEELQDIFKVNHTLSSTVDLKRVSSLITRLTCELMRADACILRLLEEHSNILLVNSVYGISNGLSHRLPPLRLGESICGRAAKEKKPLLVYDISKDPRVKNPELIIKEGYTSILCMPVLFQGTALGVLSVFSKKTHHFSREEIRILDIFASQIAVAIQESRHYEDIHKNYFDTIHALVLALEARDVYTRGHTERVTKYSIEIARILEMPKNELEILRYAAEVHDVGKISIPDFILNKPGRLTPAERAIIELHPVKGAEMLEPLEFLRTALPIVRHHHERYDGTGYPDGLEKERIPVMARILACADSFDAMTSDRPYRSRRLTVDEALAEIRNNSGSQFDPHIAQVFIKTIRHEPAVKVLP
jgi:putative methionine-R-sulfoxide reductase with GAF domain